MSERFQNQPLRRPWLIAAWPGLGNVALAAGAYLLEQLEAEPFTLPGGLSGSAGVEAHFEIDSARIEDGIIQPARYPATRLHAWRDPAGLRDLLILSAEAQPTRRVRDYCEELLGVARALGVERVVTFAAIATGAPPSRARRALTVATDSALLDEVLELGAGLATLDEGTIGGLNGALLAVAASQGFPGQCLLGEVPRGAVTVPCLRASHAVLELFGQLAGVEIDLTELARRADAVDRGLEELLRRLHSAGETPAGLGPAGQAGLAEALASLEAAAAPDEEEEEDDEDEDGDEDGDENGDGPRAGGGVGPGDEADAPLNAEDLALIESLFLDAERDLTQANALKDVLDRQGVFKEYQDRFLDLFSRR